MRITDFAVIYDITSNKERKKLSKLLQGYGFRVQKSVFECRLSKTGARKLENEIESLNIQTGFVKIYRLVYCKKHKSFGANIPEGKDIGPAFII